MRPSKTGIDFIKREESLMLTAYRDQAGIPTIGYGSTMYKSGDRVKMGEKITRDQAEELIAWEVENKSKSVSAFTSNVVLTQNQYDALVSFAFNCGIGALQNSTLLKKVKQSPNNTATIPFAYAAPDVQDWMIKKGMKEINIIHHEFMKWVKITKGGKKIISLGLQKRRQREWELYHS